MAPLGLDKATHQYLRKRGAGGGKVYGQLPRNWEITIIGVQINFTPWIEESYSWKDASSDESRDDSV